MVRKRGIVSVIVQAPVKVDTTNTAFSVQSIRNRRIAFFFYKRPCFIERRPRGRVYAVRVLARITIYRTFFYFAFFPVIPSLNRHPIRSIFHLLGQTFHKACFPFLEYVLGARLLIALVIFIALIFYQSYEIFRLEFDFLFFFPSCSVVFCFHDKPVGKRDANRAFFFVGFQELVRDKIRVSFIISARRHTEKSGISILGNLGAFGYGYVLPTALVVLLYFGFWLRYCFAFFVFRFRLLPYVLLVFRIIHKRINLIRRNLDCVSVLILCRDTQIGRDRNFNSSIVAFRIFFDKRIWDIKAILFKPCTVREREQRRLFTHIE